MIVEALHKVDVLFDLASERTISTIDPQKIFSPLHVQAHGSIEPKSGAGQSLQCHLIIQSSDEQALGSPEAPISEFWRWPFNWFSN